MVVSRLLRQQQGATEKNVLLYKHLQLTLEKKGAF